MSCLKKKIKYSLKVSFRKWEFRKEKDGYIFNIWFGKYVFKNIEYK